MKNIIILIYIFFSNNYIYASENFLKDDNRVILTDKERDKYINSITEYQMDKYKDSSDVSKKDQIHFDNLMHYKRLKKQLSSPPTKANLLLLDQKKEMEYNNIAKEILSLNLAKILKKELLELLSNRINENIEYSTNFTNQLKQETRKGNIENYIKEINKYYNNKKTILLKHTNYFYSEIIDLEKDFDYYFYIDYIKDLNIPKQKIKRYLKKAMNHKILSNDTKLNKYQQSMEKIKYLQILSYIETITNNSLLKEILLTNIDVYTKAKLIDKLESKIFTNEMLKWEILYRNLILIKDKKLANYSQKKLLYNINDEEEYFDMLKEIKSLKLEKKYKEILIVFNELILNNNTIKEEEEISLLLEIKHNWEKEILYKNIDKTLKETISKAKIYTEEDYYKFRTLKEKRAKILDLKFNIDKRNWYSFEFKSEDEIILIKNIENKLKKSLEDNNMTLTEDYKKMSVYLNNYLNLLKENILSIKGIMKLQTNKIEHIITLIIADDKKAPIWKNDDFEYRKINGETVKIHKRKYLDSKKLRINKVDKEFYRKQKNFYHNVIKEETKKKYNENYKKRKLYYKEKIEVDENVSDYNINNTINDIPKVISIE